jgi:hypothetical protein
MTGRKRNGQDIPAKKQRKKHDRAKQRFQRKKTNIISGHPGLNIGR